MDLNLKPVQQADKWQRNLDSIIIYSSVDNKEYVLNTVAARIWELSNGKFNISEIVTSISQTFEMSEQNVKDDVISFISRLVKAGLITLEEVG